MVSFFGCKCARCNVPFTVPGIGYAGLGQQTAAAQLVFRRAMSGGSSTGVRRRAPATGARRRGRATRSDRVTSRRSKPARLVRGSAAAKRYMAKIRKMRRR